MPLNGIHHITAITADARRNVDFYVRLLGLRLVKKTVNFDSPDSYHLYYGDQAGHPGSVLTFFEFPGAAPGRAGAGMVHRIVWRVGTFEALDFWQRRLTGAGVGCERQAAALHFADPDGLGIELAWLESENPPLRAQAPDVSADHALLGFEGVRAYAASPRKSRKLLERTLGFEDAGAAWWTEGEGRHAFYAYDEAPRERPEEGAGSVHHVAFACRDGEHAAWRQRVLDAGLPVTEITDRLYFQSIYFREPSGVLFEIATATPGFTVDEPLEHLGESFKLPPRLESLRGPLERTLTPIENPGAAVL